MCRSRVCYDAEPDVKATEASTLELSLVRKYTIP